MVTTQDIDELVDWKMKDQEGSPDWFIVSMEDGRFEIGGEIFDTLTEAKEARPNA